jgi:hypothetical protein
MAEQRLASPLEHAAASENLADYLGGSGKMSGGRIMQVTTLVSL